MRRIAVLFSLALAGCATCRDHVVSCVATTVIVGAITLHNMEHGTPQPDKRIPINPCNGLPSTCK